MANNIQFKWNNPQSFKHSIFYKQMSMPTLREVHGTRSEMPHRLVVTGNFRD